MTTLETHDCHPDWIDIPARHRQLDPAKVEALAKSISEIGLKHAVHVRYVDVPDDDGDIDEQVHLVAGAHRLAAIKKLGWDWMTCLVLPADTSDLDAELWEIDENLMRAELSPAEEAAHLKRRGEIWSEKNSGTTCPENRGRGRPQEFASDTAEKTGQSKRDINRKVARAEKVAVIDEVKGTSLDKGVELDALAKLPEDEQRDLAARAQAGEAVSARKPSAPPPEEPAPAVGDFDQWSEAINKLIDQRPDDNAIFWLERRAKHLAAAARAHQRLADVNRTVAAGGGTSAVAGGQRSKPSEPVTGASRSAVPTSAGSIMPEGSRAAPKPADESMPDVPAFLDRRRRREIPKEDEF